MASNLESNSPVRAEELDFLSATFNAAKALAQPGLLPPDPSAQPLDYVLKCRAILPAEMPESTAQIARPVACEVRFPP